MSKTPRVANDVIEGLRNAIAFLEGEDVGARVHIPPEIDVRAIRRRLNMTQSEFCRSFGFSVAAVREWEQGRRRPERSARILLKVIAKDAGAVRRALAS
jgi:putative transcriptional regulator